MIETSSSWEQWLEAHPGFTLTGKDDDGEDADDVEDQDEDESGEDGDADSEDDDDDDDDSVDSAKRIRDLEKSNRKLQRQLDAATELLTKAAEQGKEKSSSDGEPPEGFVAQEDYEALLELLRTDYVQNAISSFKNKDGSPKYDWKDASAVYRFLDLEDLEFDVDSKSVHGLEDQLADIAEKYPFFLKDDGAKQQRGTGRTGRRPGKSGSREKKQDLDHAALIAKFPAMAD